MNRATKRAISSRRQPAKSSCELDAFRSTDWRWQRIKQLSQQANNPAVAAETSKASAFDDGYIIEGSRCLRAMEARKKCQRSSMMANSQPGLQQVMQIRSQDQGPRTTALVEARLLAGQNERDIGQNMNLRCDTIEWYHAVFFDVNSRLSRTDWVISQVLVPKLLGAASGSLDAEHASRNVRIFGMLGDPVFNASLQMLAYYGGPNLLDTIITGINKPSEAIRNHDDAMGWMNSTARYLLTRRSVLTATVAPLNAHQANELFAVQTQIMEMIREEQGNVKTGLERRILDELGRLTPVLHSSVSSAPSTIDGPRTERLEREGNLPDKLQSIPAPNQQTANHAEPA